MVGENEHELGVESGGFGVRQIPPRIDERDIGGVRVTSFAIGHREVNGRRVRWFLAKRNGITSVIAIASIREIPVDIQARFVLP